MILVLFCYPAGKEKQLKKLLQLCVTKYELRLSAFTLCDFVYLCMYIQMLLMNIMGLLYLFPNCVKDAARLAEIKEINK